MFEKARIFLNKELRICYRNKKHALDRNAPEDQITVLSEKINVIQFLVKCLDIVEVMYR